MDFNEWFNTYGNLQCDKDACEDAFEAGQKSKKAEIDALKAKVNDALEALNDGSFNYCQGQLEEILK